MNPLPRLCMFCGKDESFGEMNTEHFVPRALWNDKRPEATITVPAHKKCNEQYSADNEYFRDMLAISDTCSSHPEVIKLNQGAIRRKLQKRRGAFVNTLKNVGIRPQFTESGLYIGDAPMFDWDTKRMEIVLHNIMKGIFFRMMEHPMPQNMELRVVLVRDDSDLIPVNKAVDAMCEWNGFGDDVFGARFVFHSQDKYMFCLMKFYRSIMFFGHGVLVEEPTADRSNGGP